MRHSDTNWAGNQSYHASHRLEPGSVSEIQDMVVQTRKLKALGTRHCFNDIADTDSVHLSLAKLDNIIELDREAQTVTIEGGVRYGELGVFLHQEGFALPNLASLPHISVAGAVITATHGSGINNRSLATSVSGVEIVVADGSVMKFSRRENPDTFPGVVVNLGALGIITQLTLDIEPAFQVRQNVFENLPLSALEQNFEAIASAAYSVSLFTDWQREELLQVWLKSRLDESPAFDLAAGFFGASPAAANRNPLPNHPPEHCTQQLGTPGPWHERLPHFRLEFTPSSGEELQSEYFVDREHAYQALKTLFALREMIAPHVFITEIRTVASDNLWLSPCYEQNCVAFHFTWKPDWPAVSEIMRHIEAALAPFHPRPHWGKLSTIEPWMVTARYPRFDAFRALVHKLDPHGKFENAYLQRFLREC